MAFRFWRRIRIAPGLTLNLSKSGGSLSVGPRGAKFTVGPRGKRLTAGLPGTGLFYTTTFPGGTSGDRKTPSSPSPTVASRSAEDRLTMGFFRRLVTPDDEKALADGCRELAMGNEDEALRHLAGATHLADGAYLAGFLALKRERLREAATCLTTASERHKSLGKHFAKYGLSVAMRLPVTDEITVLAGPTLRCVLLGLVEVHQLEGRLREAIACLERLRRLEPDDVVVMLSLAEVLLEACPDDGSAWRKIVKMSKGITNETSVHVALMLYKAKALRRLGLPTAARDTLTDALRRRKDRPEELRRAIRYERALVYEDLGRHRQAHGEFEKLYAEDPDNEEIAARLALSSRRMPNPAAQAPIIR